MAQANSPPAEPNARAVGRGLLWLFAKGIVWPGLLTVALCFLALELRLDQWWKMLPLVPLGVAFYALPEAWLVQRLSRQFDSAVVSAVVFAIGSALLLLHVAFDSRLVLPSLAVFTPGTVMLVVVSGLLASALGSLVWNRALTTLGVARTALYAYWVPIFGVGFAVAVLGEPLTLWHGIGLAGVLSGTWLGTRSH